MSILDSIPDISFIGDISVEKLKEIGYNSKRLRDEKLLGESYMTQLRRGNLVSWKTIDTLCRLLNCQVGDLVEYVEEDMPETAE